MCYYQNSHNCNCYCSNPSSSCLIPYRIRPGCSCNPCCVCCRVARTLTSKPPRQSIPEIPLLPPIPLVPPVPPIPPIPPVPPVPPAPVLARGVFESGVRIAGGMLYPFNTVLIEGNSINHVNGSAEIILAPNSTYSFNWTSEIIIEADPFNVGAALVLDGIDVPGGTATTNLTVDVDTAFVFAEGILNTGPNPGIVSLEFISDIGDLDSRATLTIELIN